MPDAGRRNFERPAAPETAFPAAAICTRAHAPHACACAILATSARAAGLFLFDRTHAPHVLVRRVGGAVHARAFPCRAYVRTCMHLANLADLT